MAYYVPKLATKSVSSAGTPVALSSSSNPCRAFTVQALPGNKGNIFLGDSTTSSSLGITLTPGASFNAGNEAMDARLDLLSWFIDAANNNDGVNILYF